MSYTKVFNPKKFFAVRKILEEISELPPGASYDIAGGKEMLGKMRWLVYDWLAHMELKEEFKVRRLQGRLVVERLPPLKVQGKKVGEEKEEISRAVEIALGKENPGRELVKLLWGDKLARGLEELGKVLGEKDGRQHKSQSKGVEKNSLVE